MIDFGDVKASVKSIQEGINTTKKENETLVSEFTQEIETLMKQAHNVVEKECTTIVNKVVSQQFALLKAQVLKEIEEKNKRKSLWKKIFNLN
jgi:hypothetical protein